MSIKTSTSWKLVEESPWQKKYSFLQLRSSHQRCAFDCQRYLPELTEKKYFLTRKKPPQRKVYRRDVIPKFFHSCHFLEHLNPGDCFACSVIPRGNTMVDAEGDSFEF